MTEHLHSPSPVDANPSKVEKGHPDDGIPDINENLEAK